MTDSLYLWMKWLHIVAVISWMAGILYLYRLLIYHREKGCDSQDNHSLLKIMEFRLFNYITVPAMLIAVGAGLTMILLAPDLLKMSWLHAKLTLVAVLVIATIYAGRLVIQAGQDPRELPSGKTLRILNELPTLLMIAIVAMVVFKAP